ncbi:Calcineurin responsive transcriptional factor [Mycena venus]|uniref:Calcineurin responsive transcriptional factor n=1 Tax=Mycena venus TaxID=2733690 RepID=A0A8H7D037_9AGAR|nr:Calcineurin responsive transcriptional factor [Mycena venus]
MFNDDNDAPVRYYRAECTWGTGQRDVGSGTRINIAADTAAYSHQVSVIGPPYGKELDSLDWKEQLQRDEYHGANYDFRSFGGSSAWSHNIREYRNSGGFPLDLLGQINSLNDVAVSWNSTAPQPSRGRHSLSMFSSSNDKTLDHNLLSPYPGVNGHRRSQSDTSSESFMPSGRLLAFAELVPLISQYKRYEDLVSPNPGMNRHQRSQSDTSSESLVRSGRLFSLPRDDEYSNSGSPFRNGASSQWPSPNPSPQSQPSYLLDLDSSPEIPIVVLKQDVTSERTMKASHLRRRKEAKYECPVAGCGSTFTRHINLNGHIRAHSDERPFVCSWDGCSKAFARLHDHKRHEQLHTIDRPFACEGCKKYFARLDALNRHLRSKGGEECR